MTLLSQVARVAYQADGATRNFPVPFRIWSLAEIAVVLRHQQSLQDIHLIAGSDYAWDASPLPGEGAVILAAAPHQGTRVVIERRAEIVQELDLVASGAFSAETIEDQFDRLAAQMQAMANRLGRAPALPAGSDIENPALPEPVPARAGQLLGIAADGRSYECKVPASLGLQTVSSFAATLLDDPDAAAARATLGLGNAIDLNLLPADPTGGAADDHVPFTDASQANASNKVPVPAFVANAIAGMPLAPAAVEREILVRNASTGAAERLPASLVGAGRHTIWIPAAALQPRLSAGAAPSTVELPANRLVLRTLDFDPLAPEHAQVLLQMPKGWNRGPLTAVLTWTHGPATTAFNVVWGLRACAMSDAGALDTAFGATVFLTDTGATANALYQTSEALAITPATPPGDTSLLAIEIFRAASEPADTLAVDARLIGMSLHYVTARNTDA